MSHLLNMVSSWPDDYFQGDGDGNTPATGPGDIPFLTASSVTKRNPHRLRNPAYPCPISAAPDSGWPDIFNSGVIVLAPPGERGFKEAMSMRSWDGGDQGTLNEWAGRQAGLASGQGTGGSGWNRLSFKYNVTPTAAYTYVLRLFFFVNNTNRYLGMLPLMLSLAPVYMPCISLEQPNLGAVYPFDHLSLQTELPPAMTLGLMARQLGILPSREKPLTPTIS